MEDNLASRPRWAIAPYFIVDDVVATANYYRDQLGFHYERFWFKPPCFCMVARSGVVIMLSQLAETGLARPNSVADPNSEAWDAYIWVENADALSVEFKSRGVTIVRDICDQPYGCRDFDVEDCNGYRLCLDTTSEDESSTLGLAAPVAVVAKASHVLQGTCSQAHAEMNGEPNSRVFSP